MKDEHKSFYRDFIKAMQDNNLAIFAGAGLSKAAGFVDWKGLLEEIADDLGLEIDKEVHDLIAIAQFHENSYGGRSKLNAKILQEFSQDAELTENHKILARLPIHTYWTTNYDDLIETSLRDAKRIADVKHSISQLSLSRPRRDAIVYKMHGDKSLPGDAVITKSDYENYATDKGPFITALSGDLVSKLFVFIGFSFADPNLDYVLSRVRINLRGKTRHHYYFIKRVLRIDPDIIDDADFEYKSKKQALFIQDLKRFQLQPVYVDSYPEITSILKEIENLYKKCTVFISGSAEEYLPWSQLQAQQFIHKLSSRLIQESFRIVNGFGWGIGSAVINGALERIYSKPEKYSEDQLIVKPFPQFGTGEKELDELWHEYRSSMIEYSGIAIFIFGNKKDPSDSTKIIKADGVDKEFRIAKAKGLFLIPVNATGWVSADLTEEIKKDDYFLSKKSDTYQLMEKLFVILIA